MTLEPASLGGNVRGRRSRARLLAAARECFGQQGYAATRIADITAAAGMSQGGFYRHFKDKNDILLEALREPLDLLLDATAPIDELGRTEDVDAAAIEQATTAFFVVYSEHRQVLRVIREAAAMHEPGLREVWLDVRGRYVERIARMLRARRRKGWLQTTDVGVLADSLGATLDQVAYTRLALAPAPPPARDVLKLGKVAAEIWLAVLRP